MFFSLRSWESSSDVPTSLPVYSLQCQVLTLLILTFGCPANSEMSITHGASQEAQWWKIYLLMQETREMQFQSLGWEDPLEEEMATHSSILAWRIPWMEEPGRLQSIGSQGKLSD